jgi:catechol 2,3-dioxygenase-like lactoylglutathione lyase family enzyme
MSSTECRRQQHRRMHRGFAEEDHRDHPPGAPTGLALVPPGPGDPVGVQTGIILNTDDIDAAHAELESRGVDVDREIARPGAPTAIRLGAVEQVGPVPPMFYVRDPDGNTLLVVEPS